MISVCITCRTDQQECNATIRSIRETAGDSVEVIVVDDGSPVPLTLEDKNVVFRRIWGRAGVGPARHIAATLATRPYLLLIDAHMRFTPGWVETALTRLKEHPKTLWTCRCACLNPEQMDVKLAKNFYHGARINFYGKNPNPAKTDIQFCEGNWLKPPPEDGAEIPCVMGASYFIPRDFFFQIGGSRMLKEWGSFEPYLSLKAWLAGGECRVMSAVTVGHQFREATTFTSKRAALLWNKMMIAATIFPEIAAKFLVDKMDQHVQHKGDLSLAKSMMVAEQRHIETERAFHEVVFERPFEWYLERWSLPKFWTSGSGLPAAP